MTKRKPKAKAARRKAKAPRRRWIAPPPRTIGVVEAADEAWSEIESLLDEMTQWRDNMEEKLSHTDKYERVSECCDTLENGSQPNEPLDYKLGDKIKVVIQDPKPKPRGHSRADRLGQAEYILDQCIDAMNLVLDDVKKTTSYTEALEQYRDECVELKEAIEGVEFPGMFG